tara:strand:+ start:75473 stop:75661 length:189 start_codon:yes stop_codon:yes gene_type:complete
MTSEKGSNPQLDDFHRADQNYADLLGVIASHPHPVDLTDDDHFRDDHCLLFFPESLRSTASK